MSQRLTRESFLAAPREPFPMDVDEPAVELPVDDGVGPLAADIDDNADYADPRFTELGNAKRLVEQFGQDIMHVPGVGWHVWDGRRWALDITGHVVRHAKQVASELWQIAEAETDKEKQKAAARHCIRSESSGGITGTLKLAETESGVTVPAESLDADGYLFNVRNGTIDLRTGELHRHDRGDKITRLIDVNYDPAATSPRLAAFLEDVQPQQEMRRYLQRIAGYAATGDITRQELIVLYGAGANGKSVFVDMLLSLLGDYAGTAPDSLLTLNGRQEHPTEQADLQGKRLIVASETDEGAKFKIALVKKLTGDQRIKARKMRQDFYEFDRTHKTWLVTNNKPRVDEGTHAVWRRLRLVPFAVTIPEERRDPHLIAKLLEERAGILRWIVEGCIDCLRKGMRTPKAVLDATKQYQVESDRLADYREARLVLREGIHVTRADLFEDYLKWAKDAGEHDHLGDRAFYTRIRQLPNVEDDKWKEQGKTVRGFTGIGLGWMHGKEEQ
ncbi:MAG: phage/plasmid primase, P4 family [Planctomycetota bacterium]